MILECQNETRTSTVHMFCESWKCEVSMGEIEKGKSEHEKQGEKKEN